ncbi:MAG: hypothetical protein HKN14_09845 [Marinicaulis sp.]|nr:hypothetical protein [Marinicaulis sp.]NNE41204.1 hypothetical protein [Marinicaulis sp.]
MAYRSVKTVCSAVQRKAKNLAKDRKGSTAIMFAILTPVMIAGLAYGSEVGGWELSKRKLQNAADTAAFAAGTQLRSGRPESELETAATLIAGEGGYDTATGTLTLASPPVSGAYAGDPNALHLTLRQPIERKFSKLIINDPVYVTVDATALVNNGRPACVLALSPTASGAVHVQGSTDVDLDGCDVAANSIASDAINMQGAAQLEADCLSAVGGVSTTSNLDIDCATPIENGPVTADPYRDRVQPTAGSCAPNNNAWTKKSGKGKPSPGTYCGGGQIKGTVELDPGVYILDGGSWKINAGADLSGDDVTLFFTGGATIDVNGSADVDLSAPTSGNYAGIVIWFDRADTGSHKFNGGSGFSVVGAVYGAKSDIEFTGSTTGGSAGECTQIIGYTVKFSGNSDFDTDCSASGTSEIRTAQSINIVE